VCDAAGACSHVATPAGDCLEAGRGRLDLVNRRRGDRLVWRWAGRTPGRRVAFGDPLVSTGFAFCLYRGGSGDAFELALDAEVPPGGRCGRRACWKRVKKGFDFRDRSGRHGGVGRMRLRVTQVAVDGGGARLATPALPFSDGERVVAQLRRNDGGACWGTTFTRPRRQSSQVYRARTN
jgi:hypothetical protein